MPALAESPIVQEAVTRRREYLVKFPLFVNNPCLFYPDGVRDGQGRPCIMSSRNNHDIIDLIEIRPGVNAVHTTVRHIDDPFLRQNPRHRQSTGEPQATQGGAWDYCEGVVYGFLLPGQLPRIPPDAMARLMELHDQGKSDAEVSRDMATKGLTAEVVGRLIAMQS